MIVNTKDNYMVVVWDVVFSSVLNSKAFVVGGYMTGQRQVA